MSTVKFIFLQSINTLRIMMDERSEKWRAFGGHSPVVAFFNMIHPVSDTLTVCIDNESFPVHLEKGQFLIKPEMESNHLYFVLKGVIRGYIKEGGKEITTWINEENEIVGSIRNLGLNIPSEEYLQALEDSDLIALPNTMIDYLYEHFPEANIIGRRLMEENYRGAEERAYISRITSARKRYNRFEETRGSLLNRISLKYIASYLGMTLETMSRIRGNR